MKLRGTKKFYDRDTARVLRGFMAMNDARKLAGLPKYVPPHRRAAPAPAPNYGAAAMA